ncbi:MAG: UDP-N-acetylmuramate--L-alanine ligase [Bacteroidetes bacterium HGW-Bacteroidetes-5]|jgi:UDP-N-acetylmuramate--alanine ligase|nr:MAG: UDP-N-acetylmuramate--L-alanine ligase [Bacteroidetes bacterium HGW-Bacteroidetes-5]
MIIKNIYLLGIGGIGMSALARYYNHNGLFVAGYDRTPSKLTGELEDEGIEIHYIDSQELIPERLLKERESSLIIYTPAVPKESTELNFFQNQGYRIVKRSMALGLIASQKRTLAVAGTHGKTTTSTLLAHLLTHSGSGCTAFLGGISKNYHTNLLLDKGDLLVAEADEFDRSFLQLWPDIAVITSSDADHLDIYNDHKTILEAFRDFAAQVKESGSLIIKKGVDSIVGSSAKAKIYSYSYDSPCDFYASDIKIYNGGFFDFTLNYPGGSINHCTLGIPGWINVENAIAASAVATLLGVEPEKIREALAAFMGVERRFDIRLNTPVCSYIDDYAHHPKEISAAISSIRNIFEGRRLTGIFQPHLYTRTRDFAEEFAQSLSMLDELILLDIYPARELPIEGVTSSIILDNVKLKNKVLISKDKLMDELKGREIDTLITFGAGDIDRFIEPITEYLKQRYNV